MKSKKIIIMGSLLLALVLLGTGTLSYFRRTVNGNIIGNTGVLVFKANGSSSETLEFSFNRSEEEPYVLPDDSGYFDLEISAEGSADDVYVTLDILRDNLPDNLKFYTDEEHKVEINKRYFFFEKTGEMTDNLRIYWFWDGSVDDVNDTLFMNKTISARISLTAEPMEYGMMKNGFLAASEVGAFEGLYNFEYITGVREMIFTNDFSGMPEECTEENLCFDISYEENQKYPVYAYLVDTGEDGIGSDNDGNEIAVNLYNLYIVCSKTIFAPIDSTLLFCMNINLRNINFNNWFNTSLVTNMTSMFWGCVNLTSLDLSSFNTSSVTVMDDMFQECSNLISLDLNSFDTSGVTAMSRMFVNCSNLTSLDLSSFDTSSVTVMDSMFDGCSNLTSLDLSSFDTSNVIDMQSMFADCSNLTSLDLRSLDTSNVTYMSLMFAGCSNLTSLDLRSFDTSSVTDMDSMFIDCSNLTSLDLRSFDTSKVTDMNYMFAGCIKLTTTITIRGNVSKYTSAFYSAATEPNSKITVNYTSETSSLVDSMIATKSNNSNVVKGSLVS